MKKRPKTRSHGPLPWVAAAAAVTSGVLLWQYARAGKPAPKGGVCDPGTHYDPKTGTCVVYVRRYPPHGTILIVGGEIALGLAKALQMQLAHVETSERHMVIPMAMSVWDGAPVLFSVEGVAQALAIGNKAFWHDCVACPPDVVILVTGEVNALSGPADAGTATAITHITETFQALENREGFPAQVMWVAPAADEKKRASHYQSAFLALLRTQHGEGALVEPHGVAMKDDGRPTDAGYQTMAKIVANKLVEWSITPVAVPA